MHSWPIDPFSQATAFPGWCGHPEYAHLHYTPYPTRPLLASRRTSAEGTSVCQDALNWSSRLRETHRASPLAHPTTSRPEPKAWVTCVACGTPPPHMGRYGPPIWHRTTLRRRYAYAPGCAGYMRLLTTAYGHCKPTYHSDKLKHTTRVHPPQAGRTTSVIAHL